MKSTWIFTEKWELILYSIYLKCFLHLLKQNQFNVFSWRTFRGMDRIDNPDLNEGHVWNSCSLLYDFSEQTSHSSIHRRILEVALQNVRHSLFFLSTSFHYPAPRIYEISTHFKSISSQAELYGFIKIFRLSPDFLKLSCPPPHIVYHDSMQVL